MIKKVAILMIAAGAYAVGFWPSWWVRDAVLKAFGNPAYEGVWILIPHVFLYTTLSALTCLVLWLALVRLKWLEPIPFAISRSVAIWGLIGGSVSAVAAFGVFAGLQPRSAPRIPNTRWNSGRLSRSSAWPGVGS